MNYICRLRIGAFFFTYYLSPRPDNRGVLDRVRAEVAAMINSGTLSQDELNRHMSLVREMLGEILCLIAVSK